METNAKLQKSKRLVSFSEFTNGKGLSRVYLAGFKRFVKKDFMTEEDWTKALSQYQNR